MRFTFHNGKPIESTLNQDNLYLTIASKIMIDLSTPGKKLSLLGKSHLGVEISIL
jgi:hypothetical protein